MVHNTTWLVLFVWLFCIVPTNAHWHEPDGVGDGNSWESATSDERIISPELAWWYFDTDWDIGFGIHESDRAASDWRQGNFDRDLFNSFELCDHQFFKLGHDPSIDWHRCNKSCEGRFNVTDNGENDDISLYGGGKYVLNNSTESVGIENLIIASDSVCYFNAVEIQTDLTMYGGTFTIEDNPNSQLDMPTTITNYNGTMDFGNDLNSLNNTKDAFDSTTFVGYGAIMSLGKTNTWSLAE